ncbi:MAG: CoA pyrophosphatase [Balneolaceae bacterium]|nr:MAG: CoA pyrophosphatase [Balneolaceae bacterium]
MNHHPFYTFLKNRPSDKLPGRDAQLKMSPVPLDPDFVLPQNPSETAHPSSVLIPLYTGDENRLRVVLTLRTNNIRHAGQISFPGGRCDTGESLLETALRETKEEIGIESEEIEIACNITPLYLYRTDNQITPFVGFLAKKPELKPNPVEVEEAFSVTMEELLSDKALERKEWHFKHASFNVPYWNVHRVPLWGATAMMLNELIELFREFQKTVGDLS